MKKILTFGIMLMFILMTVSSANETYMEKQTIKPVSFGNILYVGGNGTGNYSSIQEAINNSNNGDTVYVYDDSSPYLENLDINKSISLMGENKNSTIINCSIVDDFVVDITADSVVISGFTIKKYDLDDYWNDSIINIKSDYNAIKGNIITGNTSHGISLNVYFLNGGCNYTNISNNIITGNLMSGISVIGNLNTISNNSISVIGDGISVASGDSNKIIRNTIEGCGIGIFSFLTRNTYICRNIITNNSWGISSQFFGSVNSTVILNEISYNHIGIYLSNSINGKVTKNNFIGNNHSAYFNHMLFICYYVKIWTGAESFLPKIHWNGNYWDEPKLQQYIIPGLIGVFHFLNNILARFSIRKLPSNWINLDRNPAQEPYDIGV